MRRFVFAVPVVLAALTCAAAAEPIAVPTPSLTHELDGPEDAFRACSCISPADPWRLLDPDDHADTYPHVGRHGVARVLAVTSPIELSHEPSFFVRPMGPPADPGRSDDSSNSADASNSTSKKDWTLFYLSEMGVGYGTRADVGYGHGGGVLLSLEALSLAFGFEKLRGVGFGTCLYEGTISPTNAPEEAGDDWSGSGLPGSWLPVYVYFPVHWNVQAVQLAGRSQPGQVRSPCSYLFAGGSRWSKPNDYFHAGISTILTTHPYVASKPIYGGGTMGNIERITETLMTATGAMNIAIQLGFFYSPEYEDTNSERKVDSNGGLYLSFRLGSGAVYCR